MKCLDNLWLGSDPKGKMTVQAPTFLPCSASQLLPQPQSSSPAGPELCLYCLGYKALAGGCSQRVLHFRAPQPCTCHVSKECGSRSVDSMEPMKQGLAKISKFSWLSSLCISPAHSFPPPHPSTASFFLTIY